MPYPFEFRAVIPQPSPGAPIPISQSLDPEGETDKLPAFQSVSSDKIVWGRQTGGDSVAGAHPRWFLKLFSRRAKPVEQQNTQSPLPPSLPLETPSQSATESQEAKTLHDFCQVLLGENKLFLDSSSFDAMIRIVEETFLKEGVSFESPLVKASLGQALEIWIRMVHEKYLLTSQGLATLIHWNLKARAEPALQIYFNVWIEGEALPPPETFFNPANPTYQLMELFCTAATQSRIYNIIPFEWIGKGKVFSTLTQASEQLPLLQKIYSLKPEEFVIYVQWVNPVDTEEYMGEPPPPQQVSLTELSLFADTMITEGEWEIYGVALVLCEAFEFLEAKYSVKRARGFDSFQHLVGILRKVVEEAGPQREPFLEIFGYLPGGGLHERFDTSQPDPFGSYAPFGKWRYSLYRSKFYDRFKGFGKREKLNPGFIFAGKLYSRLQHNLDDPVKWKGIYRLLELAGPGSEGFFFLLGSWSYHLDDTAIPRRGFFAGLPADWRWRKMYLTPGLSHLEQIARLSARAGEHSRAFLGDVIPVAEKLGWIEDSGDLDLTPGGLGDLLLQVTEICGDKTPLLFDWLWDQAVHAGEKEAISLEQLGLSLPPWDNQAPLFHLARLIASVESWDPLTTDFEFSERNAFEAFMAYATRFGLLDLSAPVNWTSELQTIRNYVPREAYRFRRQDERFESGWRPLITRENYQEVMEVMTSFNDPKGVQGFVQLHFFFRDDPSFINTVWILLQNLPPEMGEDTVFLVHLFWIKGLIQTPEDLSLEPTALEPPREKSFGSDLVSLVRSVPTGREEKFQALYSLAVRWSAYGRSNLISISDPGDFDGDNFSSLGSLLVFASSLRADPSQLFSGAQRLELSFNQDYLHLVSFCEGLGLSWNDFLKGYNPAYLAHLSLRDLVFYRALSRDPIQWEGVDQESVKAFVGEQDWIAKAFNILESNPSKEVWNLVCQFLIALFSWTDDASKERIIEKAVSLSGHPEAKSRKARVLVLLNRLGQIEEGEKGVFGLNELAETDPELDQIILWVGDPSLPEEIRRKVASLVPLWLSMPIWELKEPRLKSSLSVLSSLVQYGISEESLLTDLEGYLYKNALFDEWETFLHNFKDSEETVIKPFYHRLLYDAVVNPTAFAFAGFNLNEAQKRELAELEAKTELSTQETSRLSWLKNQFRMTGAERVRFEEAREEACNILAKKLLAGQLETGLAHQVIERAGKKDRIGLALRLTIAFQRTKIEEAKEGGGNLDHQLSEDLKALIGSAEKPSLPPSPDYKKLFPPGKKIFTGEIFMGSLRDPRHHFFLKSWQEWFRLNGYHLVSQEGDLFIYEKEEPLIGMKVRFRVAPADQRVVPAMMRAAKGGTDLIAVIGHTSTAAALARHIDVGPLFSGEENYHAPIILNAVCYSWPQLGPLVSATMPEAQMVGTDQFTLVWTTIAFFDVLVNGLFQKKSWGQMRDEIKYGGYSPREVRELGVYRFPDEKWTLAYRDPDGDGITNPDDHFDFSWGEIKRTHRLDFEWTLDVPAVSLQNVISTLNGTFSYDPFLRHFLPLKLAKGDFDSRAGWFDPRDRSDIARILGKELESVTSEVIQGPEYNAETDAFEIAFNLGYQQTSNLGLLMMATYEIILDLQKNYELVGGIPKKRNEILSALPPEELFKAFLVSVSYLSEEYRFLGGEKGDFGQRAKDLLFQFCQRYKLPQVPWELLEAACRYRNALEENPENKKYFSEEEKSYQRVRELFLEGYQTERGN